jgi:hypothetical protein
MSDRHSHAVVGLLSRTTSRSDHRTSPGKPSFVLSFDEDSGTQWQLDGQVHRRAHGNQGL